MMSHQRPKMNWRFAFRHGRAPSMIQMRLLQTILIPTAGPKIADHYERVYGFGVARGTIYHTLSVMHARGWIEKARAEDSPSSKVYWLTKQGIGVLAGGVMKYARIAEVSRMSARRLKAVQS